MSDENIHAQFFKRGWDAAKEDSKDEIDRLRAEVDRLQQHITEIEQLHREHLEEVGAAGHGARITQAKSSSRGSVSMTTRRGGWGR